MNKPPARPACGPISHFVSFRFILLFLIFISISHAQYYYSVTKTTALSGTAEVITVQQPAASAAIVRFIGAYIDCTVSCTITVERNGTAASSTTLAIANVNPGEPAATTKAWSGSNVGTGTVISRLTIPASGASSIDLSKVLMIGSGTNQNLTIRTSSITGTVNIIITYSELL